VPWWNPNTISANGFSISMAVGLPFNSIQATWMNNFAPESLLNAIAQFLNNNKVRSNIDTSVITETVPNSQLPEVRQEAISFMLESIENAIENGCLYTLSVQGLNNVIDEYDPEFLGDEPFPVVQQDHQAIKQQYQAFINSGNIIGGVNHLINSYSMDTFGTNQITTNYTIQIVENLENADAVTTCVYDSAGNVISCDVVIEEELFEIEDFGYVTRAIKHELYHILQAQVYGPYNGSQALREFDAYYASIFRFPRLPRVNDPARLIQLLVWFDENWDGMTDQEKQESRPIYDRVKEKFPEYCDD
ncbi:MAG: hypothetical protein AAF901_07380, partial [Bacteroidota bacterium]